MIFTVTLCIGLQGRQEDHLEIPDDELDECSSEDERQELIDSYWRDWAWNFIDGGIYPAEDGDHEQ